VTANITGGKPSRLRRLAAAVALAALVAALVYLAISAIYDWYVLLASVVTLGVAVIAAWYILSRRGVARAVASVVTAVALAAFAVLVLATESIIVLGVGLGLAAVSISAASYALSPVRSADNDKRAPRARHPVLLMNLKSINYGVISRSASASTATGYAKVHAQEQSQIIETAFTI